MSPRAPRNKPSLRFAKDLFGRFARSTHFHPRLPSASVINVRLTLLVMAVVAAIYLLAIVGADYAIYRKGADNRFTRTAERLFPYPAAVVDGHTIPLSRFRREVNARLAYASKHNLGGSRKDIERLVISQLIDKQLYAEEIKKYTIAVSEKDVEASMKDIYSKIPGGEEKLPGFLAENYGNQIDVSDFRQWIRESLVESAIEHQILARASVKHILIAVPEGGSEAQIEAARQKALSVKSKITDPTQFGEAAKQYSEDIASRDKQGDIGTTIRGSDGPVFSQDFEDAIFSVPLNQVSDPVRSQYGWHLVLVENREGQVNQSMAALTEELRKNSRLKVFIGNK